MKQALAVLPIAGAFGLAGAASAADMPIKAPVAPVAFTWTGLYVGAHAGWGESAVDMTFPADVFFTSAPVPAFPLTRGNTLAGFLAGAHLGFNYQVGMWVLGIEGAWTWTDFDQRIASPEFPANDIWTLEQDWLASLTARVGVAGGPGGRLHGYVKGGLAATRVRTRLECVTACGKGAGAVADATTTNHGWTAGVGMEWAFYDNWILGIEYNHYDFDARTHDGGNVAAGSNPRNVDLTTDTVTARLSYKFGGLLFP